MVPLYSWDSGGGVSLENSLSPSAFPWLTDHFVRPPESLQSNIVPCHTHAQWLFVYYCTFNIIFMHYTIPVSYYVNHFLYFLVDRHNHRHTHIYPTHLTSLLLKPLKLSIYLTSQQTKNESKNRQQGVECNQK